jgi:hypothetical protein
MDTRRATDGPRVELQDARKAWSTPRRSTGTIPLVVLTSMGITIPDEGTYWFSAEQVETIRAHPDWEPA